MLTLLLLVLVLSIVSALAGYAWTEKVTSEGNMLYCLRSWKIFKPMLRAWFECPSCCAGHIAMYSSAFMLKFAIDIWPIGYTMLYLLCIALCSLCAIGMSILIQTWTIK